MPTGEVVDLGSRIRKTDQEILEGLQTERQEDLHEHWVAVYRAKVYYAHTHEQLLRKLVAAGVELCWTAHGYVTNGIHEAFPHHAVEVK